VTTWILLRAAGIGAYLMLWASIAWGLFATTGIGAPRFARASSTSIHQFLSTAGLLLLGIHLGGVLLDKEIGFSPLDILVPDHSSWRPLAITFGVLAMYGMVIILASSWARKKVGTKMWRWLHGLAIPAYILTLGHAVGAGTDTTRPWMFWMYATTSIALAFLLLARGLTARPARKKKRADAAAAAAPAAPRTRTKAVPAAVSNPDPAEAAPAAQAEERSEPAPVG
jgi:hypothetical protein